MSRRNLALRYLVGVLLLGFTVTGVNAQEPCTGNAPDLLQPDDCFRDCCSPCCYDSDRCGMITGDWAGARTGMMESGIVFQGDVTQFYQGVASGGREQRFEHAGRGDYLLNFDLGKLGVHEGLFLRVRADHRWGETINRDTGALLPAAIYADLPSASEELLLTNVLFTQMLSPTFGVFFGKLDTLDGDANAFAHKRGKDQFMNLAFVSTPVAL